MVIELQRRRETRRKHGEGGLGPHSVYAHIHKVTDTYPRRLQRARAEHLVDECAVRSKTVLEDPAMGLVDVVLDRLGVLTLLSFAAIHVAHSTHKAHVRLLDVAAWAGTLGEIPDAGEQDSGAMVSMFRVSMDCDSLLGVVG